MAKKNVTVIPASINRFTATPINSRKKRRVAGYARVSTDMDCLLYTSDAADE